MTAITGGRRVTSIGYRMSRPQEGKRTEVVQSGNYSIIFAILRDHDASTAELADAIGRTPANAITIINSACAAPGSQIFEAGRIIQQHGSPMTLWGWLSRYYKKPPAQEGTPGERGEE